MGQSGGHHGKMNVQNLGQFTTIFELYTDNITVNTYACARAHTHTQRKQHPDCNMIK